MGITAPEQSAMQSVPPHTALETADAMAAFEPMSYASAMGEV
jgi:hypothetical protein